MIYDQLAKPVKPISLRAIDVLTAAATLMGEVRGQSYAEKVAVAWTIRNRVEKKSWWGTFTDSERAKTRIDPPANSVQAVCMKPWQFSCWNSNDPSRRVCDQYANPARLSANMDNAQFRDSLLAVISVFQGYVPDSTGGATHYYNPAIANPKWDDGLKPSAVIGAHKFYAGVK